MRTTRELKTNDNDDVLEHIVNFLGGNVFKNFPRVCKNWNTAIKKIMERAANQIFYTTGKPIAYTYIDHATRSSYQFPRNVVLETELTDSFQNISKLDYFVQQIKHRNIPNYREFKHRMAVSMRFLSNLLFLKFNFWVMIQN